MYPFLENLTTQIAIFSVFHISNTARSTVIIAMQNSHFNRGVVTRGPIGPPKCCLLKSIYSEKATKFCKFSIVDLSYVVPVKSTVEISQNFVDFSEYMNFMKHRGKSTTYGSFMTAPPPQITYIPTTLPDYVLIPEL